MTQIDANLTTGLAGLDQMLRGLIPGDNIVFQVDAIDDYGLFVEPCCAGANRTGKKLIYFRFARHPAVVPDTREAEVHELKPAAGFETFVTDIHRVIRAAGRGGFYVFDCLSDLAADWYSDQMLGNFFMLTCPYLYDVAAIAYFALLRNRHSAHATEAIAGTAQVLLDVHRRGGQLYVHPIKVQQRYSPTMHMLHVRRGDQFQPVTESATISEILTSVPWGASESTSYRLGVWNRTFVEAEEALEAERRGQPGPGETGEYLRRLIRMAFSRDDRIAALLARHVALADVLDVGKRMIGTGLVGGKSVGMLLARAVLRKADPKWVELLEPHDSFYIGSDVFYTFLVRNGVWWERERQRDPETFLEGAVKARQRMLVGDFPDYIRRQLEDMLDYFGQSPIIVRSSSLLEDNYGNAFAGKYESVFCANQGPRYKRLEDFLSAVRAIYASAMSEKALTYRAQRGLLDRDEQMALLVQRVSGALHGSLFFPQIAGVGLSFNPYVWSEHIDPAAGMVRLVFGLGTRAVDRSDDDYTRVAALNAPARRPEANFDQVRQYSQRKVDVIDLEANQLVSAAFKDVASRSPELPLEIFASRGAELSARPAGGNAGGAFPWVLTFEKLFAETSFVAEMREMLGILQGAYDYPVDVEFAVNFLADRRHKINLLQCRPLQVKEGGAIKDPPAGLDERDVVMTCRGAVIGQSRQATIDRLIYVVPEVYGDLPIADRYAVAKLIGRLMHLRPSPGNIMLMGPGRWGTTTPSLGVPVNFADINTVSILCEIVAMRGDLVPDVSLGTHFLNELFELDILYAALFPAHEGNSLNAAFFDRAPNRLAEVLPEAAGWARAVRVIDPDGDAALRLNANSLKQRVVCYFERPRP